ncbi:MAG: hypothetical protein MHM6MM_009132 [Cercozoa sp. M6MM]
MSSSRSGTSQVTATRPSVPKVTSLSSDNTYQQQQQQHHQQRHQQPTTTDRAKFVSATSISSDAYFGRETPTAAGPSQSSANQSAFGDVDWEQLASTAGDKAREWGSAAANWWSGLTRDL